MIKLLIEYGWFVGKIIVGIKCYKLVLRTKY